MMRRHQGMAARINPLSLTAQAGEHTEGVAMSNLVLVLRGVSLRAFRGPILCRPARGTNAGESRGSRVPLVANLCGCGVFFGLVRGASGSAEDPLPMLCAFIGALVALAGSAVTWKSRAALGAAWSFGLLAGEQSGVVTTGPYRCIRHPMSLGLSMLALGEGIAFSSWPAVLAVAAVVPTLLWRVAVEEKLLLQVFGERYGVYRHRTKMIMPYLPARACVASRRAFSTPRARKKPPMGSMLENIDAYGTCGAHACD